MTMYDDSETYGRPVNDIYGRPTAGYAQTDTYARPTPTYSPARHLTIADVDDPSITRIDVHRLIAMSRVQRFMILRLERTLKMQRLWIESGAAQNSADPWKGKLIAKAVFSALRDCIDAGILNDGQDLLRNWLR